MFPKTLTSVTLTALILVVLTASSASAQIPTDFLGYWRLDETTGPVVDSGGGHDGTAVGITRGVPGVVGNAARFGGNAGSHVLIPHTADFPTNQVTILAWVKFDSVGGDYPMFLSGGGNDGQGWDYALYNEAGRRFRAAYRAANGSTPFVDSTTLAEPGVWYHVAMTHDGTNLSIYVNGVREATTAAPPLAPSTRDFYLGREARSNCCFLSGYLDEVQLYGRSLVPSEMDAIYDAGVAGQPLIDAGANGPVPLRNATATAQQGGWPIVATIDGNKLENQSGWALCVNTGCGAVPEVAVWQTSSPLTATSLEFDMLFNCTGCGPGHKFQNFRLSYTTSPNPTVSSGATWIPLTPGEASADFATLAVTPDGRVTAIGDSRNGDTYRVVTNGASGITGFRLDALLGQNGHVGWTFPSSNGNIVLTEFEVCAGGLCTLGGGGGSSDSTPPTVTPQVTGTMGANGWYTSDVVIAWTVIDEESAATSTGCDTVSVTTDTAGITYTCEAESKGGTASGTVTIKRDATAPLVLGTRSPAANGNGWNNGPVSVMFTCQDGMSGVVSCTGDTTLASAGAWQSAEGTATDEAGNTASATVGTIHIDLTAPVITMTAPSGTYTVGATASSSYVCADSGSGVATCTGTVASGAAIDTSTVGTKSFTVTSTDLAGNASSTTVTYAVHYGFGGFRQPLLPPVTTFKSGSTIPVKFTLTNASGGLVTTAVATVSVNGGPALGTATWDGAQYHFNLKTKGLPSGPLTITVKTDDGMTRSVTVTLK